MTQPIFELSRVECVELLYTELVGRVAFHTRHGTRIVPVNYAIVDDAIAWRTAAYSELATFGRQVEGAFEVDHFDHDARQGWSVIAYGVIEVVDDSEELAGIRRVEDPDPWAEGLRHLYMRMRYQRLTGRRLGYAAHPAYARTAVPPTEKREVR